MAFVTGGAHGIGRACVERLQAAGASVVFGDIDAETGAGVQDALAGGRAPVEFRRCDVTSEADIAGAIALANERFGSLDVVVANAGIGAHYDAAAMTEAEWDAFIAVDLKSLWLCAKHALPGMRERRRGSIVNIASIHAFQTAAREVPVRGREVWRRRADPQPGPGRGDVPDPRQRGVPRLHPHADGHGRDPVRG